jgi:hypothetical protein
VDHSRVDLVFSFETVLSALSSGIDLPAVRLRGGAGDEDEDLDDEEDELEDDVERIGASNLGAGVRNASRKRMFEFVSWVYDESEKAPNTNSKSSLAKGYYQSIFNDSFKSQIQWDGVEDEVADEIERQKQKEADRISKTSGRGVSSAQTFYRWLTSQKQ